jgi:hypothetical protein
MLDLVSDPDWVGPFRKAQTRVARACRIAGAREPSPANAHVIGEL